MSYKSQYTGEQIDEILNSSEMFQENFEKDEIVFNNLGVIKNLDLPVNLDDAVNKRYVDSAIGQIEAKAIGKTAYIGDSGNWFEWNPNTGVFIDTGIPATGPKPTKGVDYFTEEEITDIVDEVASRFIPAEEVSF